MKTNHEIEGGSCPQCSEPARLLKCSSCEEEAWIINCGHMDQPRPIAAGTFKGTRMNQLFCKQCAKYRLLEMTIKHPDMEWDYQMEGGKVTMITVSDDEMDITKGLAYVSDGIIHYQALSEKFEDLITEAVEEVWGADIEWPERTGAMLQRGRAG